MNNQRQQRKLLLSSYQICETVIRVNNLIELIYSW